MTQRDARLKAEAAILRTIATYCQTCDDGRFAEFAACFAEDAVMSVPGMPEVRGREAIEAWIARAMPPEKRGKHVTINPIVTLLDPERATASTDYLFLDKDLQITSAGRYLDELVRDGTDDWLFTRRQITFMRPLSG